MVMEKMVMEKNKENKSSVAGVQSEKEGEEVKTQPRNQA